MVKIGFISVLLVSTALFISCSPIINHTASDSETASHLAPTADTNVYGSYLAGRVAHIRKDFDHAADYYKIAYEKDPNNLELIDRLYLLLASKGRIDEAAQYATKAISMKTTNGFAYMLVATEQMHNNQYAKVP